MLLLDEDPSCCSLHPPFCEPSCGCRGSHDLAPLAPAIAATAHAAQYTNELFLLLRWRKVPHRVKTEMLSCSLGSGKAWRQRVMVCF